ncbi:CAP domain-containing protein [Streptomyces sp. G-G2]|uniref:CAP domain-containing protein n=1 Tax=Streptomyces sp. G-G2 TaxID=3046201 RepID=UPI0024B977BC|nr:CAP domain-containing protein [Streptomyces sp. G-G2]MDJ0385368.1 CAP domain-containing protein [Streptomyces sp. G-G2]
MATTPERNNKLVAWAVSAVVAAAVALMILFFGAGLARAGDGGMLDAANAERAKNGCPAWVSNPGLQAAAQSHADDIMQNGTKDGHTGSDGSTPGSRAAANGWTGSSIGEIQAGGGGSASPQAAIDAWSQDGHRNAFTDCTTTDAGAVYTTDGTKWTAVITAGAR